jgi:hypothetical protein
MAASLLGRDLAYIVGDSLTESGARPAPPISGTAASMLVVHPIQKVMRVHPMRQVLAGVIAPIPRRGEKRDAHEYRQRHHEAGR